MDNGPIGDCPDSQLLIDMARSDVSAFTTFYDRHAPRVLGLLLKILEHRGDAEDVLQEVFWQVWRQADRYDATRSTPEGWLILITRSRGLDCLRRRPEPASHVVAEVPCHHDPTTDIERDEAARRLSEAIDRLPDDQGRAIRLAFYHGLSHEQVARSLEVSLGTAKTRIRLGMHRLRNMLCESHKVSGP